MLRILEVSIENIGPISNLSLKVDSTFNMICGKNGVGKTTILDFIGQFFSHNLLLKRSANVESGSGTLKYDQDGVQRIIKIDNRSFDAGQSDFSISGQNSIGSNSFINIKLLRDIPYKKLKHLEGEAHYDQSAFAHRVYTGIVPGEIKSWFIRSSLFSALNEGLGEYQKRNLELAKSCFSKLDDSITFYTVKPTYEIFLNSPKGVIYFEYLSAGFKSTLAILLGIIKEIEGRSQSKPIYAGDFEGVIMIDELDLHLHPTWQAKIYTVLKEVFPRTQFFCTTHSPHMVQAAKSQEIIALTADRDGQVRLNPLLNQKWGCQGWTVEEILEDVMGLKDTRADIYADTLLAFNNAMEQERYEAALNAFKLLEEMLHPNNVLRKLLEIQLAGLTPEND
ncbi:AAA family ATPase [Chitinophaga horti]|uniref:AAA family ATPase n=1 Tax=Chitinophaga horti TaxID=2920382 RepID=A0ABY6J0N0_9BACT|nr:AAA family ATPase [Chitinophaga horti]UYQ92197.1 AAA family ATPase [Chitinophaga horti]